MSKPLSLAEVLKEEYRSFYDGEFPEQYLVWKVSKDHINYEDNSNNKTNFAIKLDTDNGDNFLQKVRAMLPEDIRRDLHEYAAVAHKSLANDKQPAPPPDPVQLAIVEALNKLMASDLKPLFDQEEQKRARAKGKKAIVTDNPRFSNLDHRPYLNRILIEQAYPDEIYPVNDTLSGIYAHIHNQKSAALCLSGGGIRSATFGLGILQGLARCKLLPLFNYLSTVSGGGYIGSWLTSWIHRAPSELNNNGDSHVTAEEKIAESLGKSPESKTHPEPTPVEHLREYSNYLSPKVSLFSADTWTLVAIYIRNLLLNWVVLLPMLAAVLMIPRAYASILTNVRRNALTSPDPIDWLLRIGVVIGAIGIGYIGWSRPSGARSNNSGRLFIWACLLPLILSAFLLSIFWAWHLDWTNGQPRYGLIHFVGIGIIVNALGFLFWLAVRIPVIRKEPRKLLEFVAVIISGAFAGSLLYLLATMPDFLFVGINSNIPFEEWGNLILRRYICLAVPMVLMVFLLSEILLVGLVSYITTDEDREWWSRENAYILRFSLGWAAISWLVVYGLATLGKTESYIASSIGGVTGLITLLLGRSKATPASQKLKEQAGLISLAKDYALKLAAPIFTVFLLILMVLAVTSLIRWFDGSLLSEWINEPLPKGTKFKLDSEVVPNIIYIDRSTDYYGHLEVVFTSPLKLVLLIAFILIAISLIMAYFVNINRFSLHSMYRNRLIRAYLGASNTKRQPNKFTNFDYKDNVAVSRTWPTSEHGRPRKRLMHIINIALNLVGGENLAWQERKAESFTVSPLHCGNRTLGYRRSVEYGGKKEDKENSGITIGTAMAISGAAASPNMGYHSSAFITFLMMLFNARLGWWLGNPGRAGDKTYTYEGPFIALKPLISEALGMTSDKSDYVYLSDGGHFENLGLYEMVLRRCHFIVVSDGSEDKEGTLDCLGNAVRKIRIDMGVPIEFTDDFCIFPRSHEEKEWYRSKGKYCAIGKIRYSCVDEGATDGVLIYLKPAFYGDEPRDIYEYAKANPAFPHESTADQFFTESQFESYRMLGSHLIELICGEKFKAEDLYAFLCKSSDYRHAKSGQQYDPENTPDWIFNWVKDHAQPPSQYTTDWLSKARPSQKENCSELNGEEDEL